MKMRITGQIDVPRSRFGDRAAFEMMKEAGFDGIDFNVGAMRDFGETVLAPDARSHAEKIRRISEDAGLPVAGSHAPFTFKSDMPMDETAPEFCRIVRSIEFAAYLGAPLIVVHALKLQPEDQLDDLLEEQERTLELNLRWYGVLQPYAEKAGIKIAVENLAVRDRSGAYSPRLFGDARSYTELMEKLDPAVFTGCFDVGHANLSMKDPAVFLRGAGKYVHFLHVHDNDGFRDLHIMPAFSRMNGSFKSPTYTIEWKEVSLALRDIRYDGPFNFEFSTWYRTFSDELLPEALALSVKAAAPLVRFIEGAE